MKNNTYISNNFKYGFYIPNKQPNIDEKINQLLHNEDQKAEPKHILEKEIKAKKSNIVPFEKVEGLTLYEMLDYGGMYLEREYLIFVMYDYVEQLEFFSSDSIIRYIQLLEKKDPSLGLKIEISKYVENELLKEINNMNFYNYKRVLSFLEKYNYCNKEQVDNKLYYLNKK